MRILRHAAIGICLTGLALPALGRVQVAFHDGRPVKRAEIVLSDIADITADQDSLRLALSQLKIGKAAIPGYNRRFDTERISITYLNPFRKQLGDIEVSGPRVVSISTASRTLTDAVISETLRKQILDKAPFDKDKIQFNFTSVPGQVIIPDTECQLILEPKPDCEWRGSQTLDVAVRCGDETIKKFPVTLCFRVFESVCVAEEKIKRGTVLAVSDVRSEIRETTNINEHVFHKTQDVVGKQTEQTLLPGMVLTDRNVNNPPLVRKGQRVRIIVRENSATVEVDGVAKEDGLMGERIRVRSQLNQKLVTGFVCGDGMVTLSSDYHGGIL
jgi:flagellar basal body P-ring formation protein FlgA